jgi:hypothetical protein
MNNMEDDILRTNLKQQNSHTSRKEWLQSLFGLQLSIDSNPIHS